jgi:CubicO group peptidase (beta-lactamase class C family)
MNRSSRSILILIYSALLLVFSIAQAAASTPLPLDAQSVARTEIWKSINAGHDGSLSIAITDNGRLVYAEGFAMANRLKSIPVDKDTRFNIGSISKVYCATAIMLLVDEGKIDLDKPVTVYLPEFTMADERYREITVRMLLNHSSGLPGGSYSNSFGFQYHKDFLPETLKTLAQSHLKHKPGEMAVYCNDGFSLAEMIIEKVSGKKFGAFLQERIFSPLNLTNTGLGVGQLPPQTGVTIARYYDPAGRSDPLEAVSFQASGGLSATAEDLCRFADSFSGKGLQILSQHSLAEMHKNQPAAFWGKLPRPTISLGLGWDFTSLPIFSVAGITVMGKSGGTGNYTSMMFTVPEKRISVAVIGAGRSGRAMEISLKVLDAYLLQKGILSNSALQETLTLPPTAEPIPDSLLAYEGYYAGDGGAIFKLAMDATTNNLTVFSTEPDQPGPLLVATYNGGFFHDKERKKYYLASVDGNRFFVNNTNLAEIILFQKIEPLERPQTLSQKIDGTRWLRRNVSPYEARMSVPGHIATARLLPELPGYLDFGGIKKITSPTTAGVSMASVRDANELILFTEQNQTWAWVSGMIFMPIEQAKLLQTGSNSIAISRKDTNEWYKLNQDAILAFSAPANGRIIVFSPTDSILYDSAVDQGDVVAPAGSFIELSATVGETLQVIAK